MANVAQRFRLIAIVAFVVASAGLFAFLGGRGALRGEPAAANASAAAAAYTASPDRNTLSNYLQALYGAADYEAVLALTRDPAAPFSKISERSLAEAEALIALARFAEARALLAPSSNKTPAEAFAAARSIYGENAANRPEADRALASALREIGPLAAEVWLFRARMALDSNRFDEAVSAANRAEERGAHQLRTDAIRIEAAIRSGDLDDARARLTTRVQSVRTAGVDDRDFDRLTGLLALHERRFREAVRLLSSSNVERDPRAHLLLALAYFGDGDAAQATMLIRDVRRRTPNDWVAADLAQLLIGDRVDLTIMNPSIAFARGVVTNIRKGNFDAAYQQLLVTPDIQVPATALSFLTGAADMFVDPTAPSAADLSLMSLATSQSPDINDVEAHLALRRDAVDLVISGDKLAALGRNTAAMQLYAEAHAMAPLFGAAVRNLASTEARRGNVERAIDLLLERSRQAQDDVAARLALGALVRDRDGAEAALTALSLDDTLLNDAAAVRVAARYAAEAAADGAKGELAEAVMRLDDLTLQGEVLAQIGQPDAAAARYRAQLISEPADLIAAEGYLATMTAIDRRAEAEAFIRKIIDTRPHAAALRALLDQKGEGRAEKSEM